MCLAALRHMELLTEFTAAEFLMSKLQCRGCASAVFRGVVSNCQKAVSEKQSLSALQGGKPPNDHAYPSWAFFFWFAFSFPVAVN